jgi:hypothetical protein
MNAWGLNASVAVAAAAAAAGFEICAVLYTNFSFRFLVSTE